MTRRAGFTMPEALVCMFVVAIGMSGVMALFPFGAKQMSDALIIDRTIVQANSMDGLVRNEWKIKVAEDPLQKGGNEPYWNAMDNPGAHPSGTPVPPIPANSTEPSYPVFLDPIGVVGRSGTNQSWVGDTTSLTSVPRRNMNLIGNNPPLALRMWSQTDGFAFDEDSKPLTNPAFMREYRYNALAVLQRPVNRDRNSATLKIVVFVNRRHQFFPAGSEAAFPNAATPATIRFTPGSTQISISTAADIKKGTWIMDATVAGSIRHANFYRVVSATENTPGVYDVELHTPIRRTDGRNNPATDFYDATVVVPAGISSVFERPLLTGSTNP